MRIGVPREVKADEHRVAIVPAGVDVLSRAGHEVLVEMGAGQGSGIPDEDYARAGARVVETHEGVFEQAQVVMKVKEPLPEEYKLIRKDHVLFTYFHFAASRELTEAMLASGAICVAYETIPDETGVLPLLVPMSEVAGRMAVQEAAKYLEKPMEGRGILLGGVPGVAPANVLILGGGIVGTNAAKVAAGLGAQVTILDISLNRLRYLSDIMPPNVVTLYSTAYTVRDRLREVDAVIGAVLVPGARAPRLVRREDLKLMKPGSVIIDVAVDQGGCVETVKPTTHSKPTFIVDGVVHYCVANMPGAVGRTSTYALTNATLPYALTLANEGWGAPSLRKGVNIAKGQVAFEAVAQAFSLRHTPAERLLA